MHGRLISLVLSAWLLGMPVLAQDKPGKLFPTKEPLLPTTAPKAEPGTPETRPVAPAQGKALPKRTVQLRWRLDTALQPQPRVGIWVSVDGGPWRKLDDTSAGAQAYSYSTTELDKIHCSYLVPMEGEDEGEATETLCQTVRAVPKIYDFQFSTK